jgi:hypothetical protein
MQERKMFLSTVLSLAVAVIAMPAVAHHGWAGNAEGHIELTGNVEQALSLAGPHATMKLKVDGQTWDLTLAPPPLKCLAWFRE